MKKALVLVLSAIYILACSPLCHARDTGNNADDEGGKTIMTQKNKADCR